VFLWMAYSPSSQTAWESVFYIQNQMWGGWLLRGIHHFTAQAMTVLLVLHLMQVVIDGAYKAPREINFWFGMVLLLLVLGLSLTGCFALHAGVLPGLIIVFIAGHVYLFRKHGLTAKEPKTKPDCAFWPDQVLKDVIACLAVLATVLFFIVKPRLFGHGELGAD